MGVFRVCDPQPQPNNHNLTNPQAQNPPPPSLSPHTHILHWISSSPLSLLLLPSPGFPNLKRKKNLNRYPPKSVNLTNPKLEHLNSLTHTPSKPKMNQQPEQQQAQPGVLLFFTCDIDGQVWRADMAACDGGAALAAKAAAPRPWQLRHTTGCSRTALYGARTGPPPRWLTEYDSSGLRACAHCGGHRLQPRCRRW